MRKHATVLSGLALGLALAIPAHAAGMIEVSFKDPEKFADAGRSAFDRDKTVDGLRSHFEGLAKKLPDGQTLKIEVLDVDRAGEISFNARANDIRVMKGQADWPRIKLNYTLLVPGQPDRSGTENLADMNYLQNPGRADSTDLAYERRMIDRWFDKTFTAPKAPKAAKSK